MSASRRRPPRPTPRPPPTAGHRARVSSLAWNGPLLSSGGRDSVVLHHDVRVQEHKVGQLRGHAQEVCGLKWSPSGTQLASGGNDNLLNVWDDRYASSTNGTCETPLFRCEAHQAAVKALAWCPWQRNLLASGGGTADRMIRFWSTANGSCLNSVDTHSQARSTEQLAEMSKTTRRDARGEPPRCAAGVRAAVVEARQGDRLVARLLAQPACAA